MCKISFHYNKASLLASEKVKKMALSILRKHKNIDEFIMAMGSYSFTDKQGRSIDTFSSVYRNGRYYSSDTFKYFKPINDFISEWDSVLKITGEPMRFKADGKVTTDW